MTLKKSLWTAIFMIAVCCNFYSQASETAESTSAVQTEVSSFENNTNYFNSPSPSEADSQVSSRTGSGTGGIWLFVRMVFVLAIVIVLIYGALWFIKNKTNAVKTDDEFLRRAAYISIAPGKTIEVITLIDKAYVIGVTEDGITLLGELDSKSDEQTKQMINAMNLRADQTQNTKRPLNFNDVMNLFLAKKGNIKSVFSEAEQQVEDILKNTNASQTEEENENS